jgi:putative hydroxymethylpyrimidine transport system substrate-binding protein
MNGVRKQSLGFATVALVSALFLAACGGSSDESSSSAETESTQEVATESAETSAESTGEEAAAACDSLTPVTLLLDWFPNPDHVALYVAEAKGYWKDECLDVTLQPPSDPTDPPKLVATGNVELGVSYQPEMFFQVPAGLQIKAVASLIPNTLNSMMWLEDGPIKTLADLSGKTIAEPGFGSNRAYLNAIFEANNIDPASVKVVAVKTALSQALISGAADAVIGTYGNIEGEQMSFEGNEPVVTRLSSIGVPNYDELVIIANSERLVSDTAYQDMVKAFLRGLSKGNAAAIADPTFSEQTMAAVGGDYAGPSLPLMIEATLPLLENPKGFGRMDPASWDEFGAFMVKQKIVDSAPSAADLLTNDFVPAS